MLVQEVMNLFSEMKEKENIPKVFIYIIVLKGFCKENKCDDTKKIFKKMKDNGLVSNGFGYRIHGLC